MQIRQRRFAINRIEWRSDVIELASAVLGENGHVIGALGLSAPASCMQMDKLEALTPNLVDFANRIFLSMGCTYSLSDIAGQQPSVTNRLRSIATDAGKAAV